MLREMLGATATSLVARQLGGAAAGPAGAVLGLALPFVARRLGPMGMIAMAVGAWAITRMTKTQAADPAAAKSVVTVDAEPAKQRPPGTL